MQPSPMALHLTWSVMGTFCSYAASMSYMSSTSAAWPSTCRFSSTYKA